MTVRRLFVVLLAMALFIMSIRETLDPDVWWHLRTGEAILQQGSVPRHDLFSFTVPGHKWIVQEWLTDVLMWLVYQAGGLVGLSIAFALVVTAAYMLVYVRCAGQPYLAAFVILLAFFTAALPIGVRPQMFNILFLAAFVNVMEGVKNGKLGWHSLLLLPLLTLLWANMHSGYLSGVALLGAYVVGESSQQLFGRSDAQTLNWAGIRQLIAVAAAALFIALLNPNGYELWLFPLFTLSSDAIQASIVEWSSPDFHLFYFWFFGAMMGIGVLSWLFSRKRPSWTELLLFFGAAAAGLVSARHIPLFAIVAAPTISRHLSSSLEGKRFYPLLAGGQSTRQSNKLTHGFNWTVLLACLLGVVVWTPSRLQDNDRSIAAQFPVAAVDFIEQAGLVNGRVYNTYEWGGYLIWRHIPVFIDGRTELYGNDFFLYYLQTIRLGEQWRRPLDEWAIDYVILKRSSPLATLLITSGEWREAYADQVARVFVRRDSERTE